MQSARTRLLWPAQGRGQLDFDPVLDSFDVVIGRGLDFLDLRTALFGEVVGKRTQELDAVFADGL